ncbi:hypothetical protein [uncultured Fructobacillus sp.]|uniref:hypothetical protein n=1 Tax=uncultured Fructobacillus sp. TaxID=591942 RepID=UPI0025948D1E|nr:hypothetical protein [uncultured Fructobacillus sp.]
MDKQFATNKIKLTNYLMEKLEHPTPLKIQKSLYILWAFYAGSYGSANISEEEYGYDYPHSLFEPNFEAWRYGPVDSEIYTKMNQSEGLLEEPEDLKGKRLFEGMEAPVETNLQKFTENVVQQIDKVDDFSLVARTHQDKCWSEKYIEGVNHISMDAEEIRAEYSQEMA